MKKIFESLAGMVPYILILGLGLTILGNLYSMLTSF